MDIIQAIIIGLIQGLTEFLPVSSSAHLLFAQYFLGITEPNLTFDVVLHFGTIIAVIAYFWRDIIQMIISFFLSLIDLVNGKFLTEVRKDPYKKLTWLVIIGIIPVAVVGYVLNDFIESLFVGVSIPAFFLLVTGCILYFSQRMNSGEINLKNMTWKDTLIVGCGQACALLPGLSRSGTTIATGLFLGLDKEFAAKFSFILSIPVILGATAYQLTDVTTSNIDVLPWIFGFVAAAIAGYLAISFLLKLIKERSLDIFAYYCWIVGAIILVGSLVFGL